MTDVENITCFSQFPRAGGSSGQAGHPGKHQGQQGRWGVEESGEELLAGAFTEVGQSQIEQLEFFQGALEPGGLGPGPGGSDRWRVSWSENQMGEDVRHGLQLSGLHLKSI